MKTWDHEEPTSCTEALLGTGVIDGNLTEKKNRITI